MSSLEFFGYFPGSQPLWLLLGPPCEWKLPPSRRSWESNSPPRPGTFQAPHTSQTEPSKCQNPNLNLFPSLHSLAQVPAHLAGFTSQSTTVYPPARGIFMTPLVTLQREFLPRLCRNRNCPLLCFAGTPCFLFQMHFLPLGNHSFPQ